MTDYNQSLQKLIDNTFIKVDGCLVEKHRVGYTYRGQFYATFPSLKEAIQKDRNALGNSIKKHE